MNVTRYKIGDKIRIKSIDWYERNKDNNGDVEVRHCGRFLEGMSNYCGQEHKIESIPGPGIYVLDVSFDQQKRYFFTDDMFEQPEELKEKKGFEPLDGDICFLQSKPWYGIDSIFIYRSNPKATQPCSYMHYNIQLYDSSILEGYICTEDCIDFIRLATKDEIMFLFEKLRDQRGEVWNEELKKREKISPIVLESFKINWEQRRYEIAKEAINAILSNSRWSLDYNKGYYKKDVVENALSYADELIKELKK